MRVLLVQEDSSSGTLMADSLRALDAVVEHAATGAFALQLVRRGDYDLIILNGNPREMDGCDLSPEYSARPHRNLDHDDIRRPALPRADVGFSRRGRRLYLSSRRP